MIYFWCLAYVSIIKTTSMLVWNQEFVIHIMILLSTEIDSCIMEVHINDLCSCVNGQVGGWHTHTYTHTHICLHTYIHLDKKLTKLNKLTSLAASPPQKKINTIKYKKWNNSLKDFELNDSVFKTMKQNSTILGKLLSYFPSIKCVCMNMLMAKMFYRKLEF